MALTPEQIAELEAQDAAQKQAKKPENYRQKEVDKLSALGKLRYGGSSVAEDVINRTRQLYQDSPLGTPEGQQEVYADIAAKKANPVSSPMVTAGEIGTMVLPAAGAALVTKSGAPLKPAMARALSAMGVGAASGNLMRPLSEGEDNLATQGENAAIDAGLSLIPMGVGTLYQGVRKIAHNASRALPQEAIDAFVKKVSGGTELPKTQVALNVKSAVDDAVTAAKKKASALYNQASDIAGDAPIQLNSLRAAASQLPSKLKDELVVSNNPVIKRLVSATERTLLGPNGGELPAMASRTSRPLGAEAPAQASTLMDVIDAKKQLSRAKRNILSKADPDTAGAQVISSLQDAIENDLAKWGSKAEKHAAALDAYRAGAQIYKDTVVPLTETTTVGGNALRKGERGLPDLLGENAGPSIQRAVAQNPAVKPALRQQHGVLLSDAAGVPSEQASLMMRGNAIENLYTPEQVKWMKNIGLALREQSMRSPMSQATASMIRQNPAVSASADAGGRAAIDRLLFGVEAYGAPKFKSTANQAVRNAMIPSLTRDYEE